MPIILSVLLDHCDLHLAFNLTVAQKLLRSLTGEISIPGEKRVMQQKPMEVLS